MRLSSFLIDKERHLGSLASEHMVKYSFKSASAKTCSYIQKYSGNVTKKETVVYMRALGFYRSIYSERYSSSRSVQCDWLPTQTKNHWLNNRTNLLDSNQTIEAAVRSVIFNWINRWIWDGYNRLAQVVLSTELAIRNRKQNKEFLSHFYMNCYACKSSHWVWLLDFDILMASKSRL